MMVKALGELESGSESAVPAHYLEPCGHNMLPAAELLGSDPGALAVLGVPN